MSKTVYVSLSELNEPQTKIMEYIDVWAHQKKTPIPLKEVIANMTKKAIKKETTIYSLKILRQKGFIRPAEIISNRTFYVQLRRV